MADGMDIRRTGEAAPAARKRAPIEAAPSAPVVPAQGPADGYGGKGGVAAPPTDWQRALPLAAIPIPGEPGVQTARVPKAAPAPVFPEIPSWHVARDPADVNANGRNPETAFQAAELDLLAGKPTLAGLAILRAGPPASLLDGNRAARAAALARVPDPPVEQADEYHRKWVPLEPAPQEAAIAALGDAATQQQYRELAKVVGDAGDTGAAWALQQLLLDGRGRLTRDRTLAPGGRTLLAELHALATGPRTAIGDPKPLARDMIQELQDPARIAQHKVGTCTATCAQIRLARLHPAEYVRLVAGLADEPPKLHGGKALTRVADWAAGDDNDGGVRSTSSRLLQSAFMAYGDPRYGVHAGGTENHAISKVGWAGLMHQLDGQAFTTLDCQTPKDRAAAMAKLEARLAAARHAGQDLGGIPVSLFIPTKPGDRTRSHAILIDRIEGVVVHLMNPWGSEQTMSRQALMDRL